MLLRNQRRRSKVPLHIPLPNDGVKKRPRTLDRFPILLVHPATRQLGVLDVPRRVLQDAIGFPDVEQLLADSAGRQRAFVREAVADCLDEIAGARGDVLGEMVGAVVRVAF